MDGAGAAVGLLETPAVVGVDYRVYHDAGGVGSGCRATCDCCSSSTTPSSSSSSLGTNSGFGVSTSSSSSTTSSSDFMDDATSPSGRPSPLCEMNSLMDDLPIKRGLSRHFLGKSQSFMSLAAVASLEDLAKPVRGPWRQRSSMSGAAVRACKSKSYAAGLDHGHGHLPPISPSGRAIFKPKKQCPCLARRINGGGGLWGAAATGFLLPVHAHHQRHGSAASGCLRRHQQHALLFAS